jgi:hypothetical protein
MWQGFSQPRYFALNCFCIVSLKVHTNPRAFNSLRTIDVRGEDAVKKDKSFEGEDLMRELLFPTR